MGWRTLGRSREAGKFRKGPDHLSTVVSLQQVSKSLNHVQVLSEISLDVGEGQCAVLVGRNGSGKSTLLRLLAGILLPDIGTVHRMLKGQQMYALDGLPRLPFTAAEYLWEMGRIRGMRPEILRQRIDELSELLFLGTATDQKLPLLSKGTLQKVNLIQALLPGPGGLLLLDEPLSGLDVPAQEAVVSLLEQWKMEGTSIVTACHEPLLVERMADHVIVLQKGSILRHWTLADLKQLGEPAVSIQSTMKDREHVEQSNLYSNIAEDPGVLSIHRHRDRTEHNECTWDWKVTRSSADRMIGMILAAGGSIVSVQQEKSGLHMERLLEGHHPAEASIKERVTEAMTSNSLMNIGGGRRR